MMRNRSLAFKLIVLLSGGCALVLLAIFAVNYRFSRRMIMAEVEENARNLTLRTANKIESVTLSVQKVPDSMARFMETGSMDNDRLHCLLRTVGAEDKQIVGVSAMFEPYAFEAEKRWYAPYYFKSGAGVSYSETPNYPLEDYYQVPRELGTAVWSEPYVDPDAKVLMVTYSAPFRYPGTKKFRGVISADISLEWLKDVVSSVRVLNTGDAFLISRDGTIITHPVRDFIMNDTIFSVAEARGDARLREVGRRMIRGESGFVRFESLARHKASWLYFAPVPSTGWALGVVFPEDEFMAPITSLNHTVAAIGLAGLALLVLVIVLVSRSITGPLSGMARAAEKIGTGDLEAWIPEVCSGDEVGKLSAALLYMKTSLKKYIKDLKATTAAKERIESELKIAHEIQASMLPRIFPPFPDRKEFELFAMMEPAKEVGGDFFDFFMPSGNKLFFLIGDVSGKGVPAALFMMITKTLMKNEALQGLPPDEALRKVNEIVALDNDSSMFATVFCGVLDTDTGEVQFSNAGHNPPLVCRGATNEYLKMDHGFVLGPMPGSAFTLQKMKLEPGETLFLYTDGVTEAMNPEKQLFSEKRLQSVLAALGDMEVSGLIGAVREEVKSFAAGEPQSDDITMLAVRFKGRGQ